MKPTYHVAGQALCLALTATLMRVPGMRTARAEGVLPAAAASDPSGAGVVPPALSFEPNRGQFEAGLAFVALAPGYRFGVSHGRATWTLQPQAGSPEVRSSIWLKGSRPGLLSAEAPRHARSHYARGRDESAWQVDVPHFGAVRESGVYPGIDVVYRGRHAGVEYDFEVAAGADPALIRLRFDGAAPVAIDADGTLRLTTSAGELRHHAPVAFQGDGGQRREVSVRYVQRRDTVGFTLGPYDHTRPLVIDPVVTSSSFIGNATWDEANDVAVDPAGNAYVVGGASPSGWKDVAVTKVGPNGNLVYRTFLSGANANPESAYGVAVDAAGNAYITGWSASQEFPLRNHVQFYGDGMQDAFVTKLDPQGRIVYSTYLGGRGEDHGYAIAIDGAGAAYVAGWTSSPDFPVVNAWQTSRRGDEDAWVAKLSPDGGSLLFSTYLGGSGNETARGIAFHPTRGVHVVGRTTSPDFPVAAALQTAFGGGADDAFVTRLDAASGALLSSTYRGGADSETASDVAVDASGAVYITGWAMRRPAVALGFVEKLAPGAGAVLYSTYGRGGEALAVAGDGRVFTTGARIGLSFDRGYTAAPGPAYFFSLLDPNGTVAQDFGGTGGRGLALDPNGEVVIVGNTHSALFPTWRAFQPRYAGDVFRLEGFVTRIAPGVTATAAIEEDDPNVAYEGDWVSETAPAWSGGSGTRASEAGARATFTFTGTAVQLLGQRGPGGGRLKVTLDDGAIYRDLELPVAAPAVEPRALLLSIGGLADGPHVLRLEVVGDGPVWIDGFDVETSGPTPTPRPTPRTTPTPRPTPSPTATPRPTATPTPGATRFENTAAAVAYAGSWYTNTSGIHSGGSASLALDPGARATLTFTGVSVRVLGYRDEWAGIARVTIDGVAAGTIDFYGNPGGAQIVVYASANLSPGTHTIAIEATWTRNVASAGNWIWLDAFDVVTGGATPGPTPTPSPTPTATPRPTATATPRPTARPTPAPTRHEDTSPAVTYSGSWFTNTWSGHSGGSARLSLDAGDRATFAFEGTGVALIGYQDEWAGIARVYVDGGLRGNVDFYAAPGGGQKVLFTASGLPAGTHTIAVEVTGTRNPVSGGGWIWLDAFDVVP